MKNRLILTKKPIKLYMFALSIRCINVCETQMPPKMANYFKDVKDHKNKYLYTSCHKRCSCEISKL